MDEPDSALSPEAKSWLYRQLNDKNKTEGTTFVIVSHNDEIEAGFSSENVVVHDVR